MVLASAGAVVVLALNAPHAPAQGIARVRCDSAAMFVAGRGLPQPGSADWGNWVALTGCGSRGAAVIAGALRSSALRSEKDVAELDVLTGLLDGWYAPQLITTYQYVAAASDATPAIRLRSMWLLAGLFAPTIDVAGPLQGFTLISCKPYARTTALRDAPSSIPPGALEGVRTSFAGIARDLASPESVRMAAQCWEDVVSGQFAAEQVSEGQKGAYSTPPWTCTWCVGAPGTSGAPAVAGTGAGGVVVVVTQPAGSSYNYPTSYAPSAYDSPYQYPYPGSYYPYPYAYPYPYLVVGVPVRVGRPLVPFRGGHVMPAPIGVGVPARPRVVPIGRPRK
jgi:hypothetical protein